MAILNPPNWLQQGSYDARADRLPFLALLDSRGVAVRTHYSVQQTTTPSMGLTVTAGQAFIAGDTQAYQGVYIVTNDGPVSLSVPASDNTYSRIDLVVLRVYDAFVTGSQSVAAIEVIPGTPSNTPQPPTRPATSIELARITVPRLATSIVTSNISTANKNIARLRAAMSNTVETVSTAGTFPTDGDKPAGSEYFASNTAMKYMYDGTKYVPFGDTGWKTLPLASGWTAYTSAYTPRYRIKNGMCILGGLIKRSSGAATAESVISTLPAEIYPDLPFTQFQFVQQAGNTSSNLVTLSVYPATNNLRYKYGSYSPWISLDALMWPVANL